MKSIELSSQAKINLSLDILKKRPDGYHEVQMIMQTLGLHDLVSLEILPAGMEIRCNSPWVPCNRQNIAYKAAMLMLDIYGIKTGLRVTLDKRIPVAAGLAGGSSNAAAVLKGINRMFDLGASEPQLMALGKQIGADVPYCIKGGTMLSEGIGEILTELSPMPEVDVVLVRPKIGVSTAWVYENLKLEKITARPETVRLMDAIRDGDTAYLAANMVNVLETVTIPQHPIIDEIKKKLLGLGAMGSLMSGSGPTVFALFENRLKAQEAYEKIKGETRWESILTNTEGVVSHGK